MQGFGSKLRPGPTHAHGGRGEADCVSWRLPKRQIKPSPMPQLVLVSAGHAYVCWSVPSNDRRMSVAEPCAEWGEHPNAAQAPALRERGGNASKARSTDLACPSHTTRGKKAVARVTLPAQPRGDVKAGNEYTLSASHATCSRAHSNGPRKPSAQKWTSISQLSLALDAFTRTIMVLSESSPSLCSVARSTLTRRKREFVQASTRERALNR
jgi:hypothetical protein